MRRRDEDRVLRELLETLRDLRRRGPVRSGEVFRLKLRMQRAGVRGWRPRQRADHEFDQLLAQITDENRHPLLLEAARRDEDAGAPATVQ